MRTRVRVKRAALIRVVEGRVKKGEREYARAAEAYPGKVERWQGECVAALETALAKALKGKIPTNRYGSPEVRFPDKPVKPSEGRELCNLRRMLATLKMGAEETVLLSQEDADAYFGPCNV